MSSKKQSITAGKVEETKINFFDADKYEEQQAMMGEKPEEQQIIEAKIDPLEWKQEVDRNYNELNNII